MSLNPNQIPRYAVMPKTSVGTLNAATAGAMGVDTNGVTIFTADTNVGSRVYSLMLNTDDTAAVNCFIYILRSGTVMPLGMVNVPLSSGNTAALANIDALAGSGVSLLGLPVDNTGKRYIEMQANDVLKMSCLATMTAAKKCYGMAMGADYYN